MMDQYNMDQYNKETSQIHAPADLIRRTKEAVREEEQRLAGERLQQHAVTPPKHSYVQIYKWALPVAAAIFCVVLLNVGLLRFRKDMSGSGSSSATAADAGSDVTASDTASVGAESNGMGLQFETAATYEEAAEAEEEFDNSSSVVDMSEVADGTYESKDTDAGGTGYTGVAVSAEEDVYEDTTSREMGKNEQSSYIDSIYGSDLWIDTVDEAPSFYGDSDTEIISIHGIKIYVAKDIDYTWIAYSQIGEGRYVIRGELTEGSISRDEFAEKAYQLLEETIDRSE